MDEPNFSHSVGGGKRTEKAEARINYQTKSDLQRKCHELGISESDYIDRLIHVSLYGIDHVLSLQQELTAKVCGLSAVTQKGVS